MEMNTTYIHTIKNLSFLTCFGNMFLNIIQLHLKHDER